jgi:hypothetical protein
MPGFTLPVGLRPRFLLHVPAARLLTALQVLAALLLDRLAAQTGRPSAFIHTGLTRARGSMFTHFTPADLVAILNIPRLQTLPNSLKILTEYRLSVVALVFFLDSRPNGA